MSGAIPLILLTVVCGVTGQLALKTGMSRVGRIGTRALSAPLDLVKRIATSPLVVVGLALYVLGAALWLTVLSQASLSFAYPILALSYAFTPIFARLVLGESVPTLRWAGILTICLGVFLVSQS